ncbi:PREDICTED: telomere repeat-binding protein 5-like isoform X2 [Lupinus angustifolius]|uniref:telomere repeat-binding protein 5-like isoform X2 n=1 Tax=Lupinus angustifolius TaxID=3871 RepID=UPI00092FB180|nr:PREDICTED: telomere repeat-binding protein 5-like isoform X2 [Lupinus angustifolius]
MVFQKSLEYRFNGYQVPATARRARSTRRRAKFQRRVEDNQICAFELLATIAGKLLQEKENPTMTIDTSSEKDQSGSVKECQNANKLFKAELSDEGSCDNKCFSLLSSQTNNPNCCLSEFPNPEIDVYSGIASIVTSSNSLERVVADKLVDGKSQDGMENVTSNAKLDSTGYAEVSCCKLDGDTSEVKDELHKFQNVPIENPTALINLDDNVKLSGYNDGIPCSSFSKGCGNVPVVSRDDDEKFSGCSNPCTKTKSFRPITSVGDRVRKTLASKYSKVAQESKVHSNNDGDFKPTFHIKKYCYKRQRSQMNIPLKKRKLFNCSSVSNSNKFIRSGGIYHSPENDMSHYTSGSSPGRMRKDHGIDSLERCQHSALQCGGSHVKLRIRSFRVPELFIEIPETATIGSLKRTVLDAVTAILGGGLRVGVSLQGKKVRDDSKTLIQTGISLDSHLGSLGFTLEPNSSPSLLHLCAAHSSHVPSAEIPQSPIRPAIHQRVQGSLDMLPDHQVTNFGNFVVNDHDSTPSPINTSVDKSRTDSKALDTVPEMGEDELAMVPVLQKSKRSEIVQRRIRRPFSVEEVEALVHAVEKLGTGRWRDVKVCAFDNAKHRTYVDLKDKWKTLVHTARISPQQRRGEQVPQQLLNRVLIAHAYWSQQQNQETNTTL